MFWIKQFDWLIDWLIKTARRRPTCLELTPARPHDACSLGTALVASPKGGSSSSCVYWFTRYSSAVRQGTSATCWPLLLPYPEVRSSSSNYFIVPQALTENIFIYCWAPELNCKLNYVMRPRSAVDVAGGSLEILFVLKYCIVWSEKFLCEVLRVASALPNTNQQNYSLGFTCFPSTIRLLKARSFASFCVDSPTHIAAYYYAPAARVGDIKLWCASDGCLTSVCRVHRT